MRFLFVLLTIALTSLVFGDAKKPSVVLILADDLGWRDLGFTGSKLHLTPHLDELAAGGMHFTRGYASSSVCSPTRGALMTGKAPARTDLTIWLGGRGGADALDALPLEETTVAEAFLEGGWRTGMVGKWHLGGDAFWPKTQGFETAVGEPHSGSPAGGYHLPNRIKLLGAKEGDYLTDRLSEEGALAIERWAKAGDRFFLFQAYHSVHTPIQGKASLVAEETARLDELGVKSSAHFAAMVRSLDEGVGRLVTALRENGRLDHTVIVFTSDNGGYSRYSKNAPLRAGKGHPYEAGHRVPMIIHYPDLIGAGSTCDAPVITTDLYPTLLDLAGLPLRPDQHLDGRSLVPLLSQPETKFDRALHWHFPHWSPQGGQPAGAIIDGDWKLIEFFGDGANRIELYDLKQDEGEAKDLSKEHPERAAALLAQLDRWQEEVGAKVPPQGSVRGGKKPAPSTAPPSALSGIGAFTPTKEATGFSSLENVELTENKEGAIQLGSASTGTALRARKGNPANLFDHTLEITPRREHPANGFLVLGEGEEESELIKCGVLVRGGSLSIFEGSYPSGVHTKKNFQVAPGAALKIRVRYLPGDKDITLRCGETTVTHALSRPLSKITHYGYQVIRTRTQFTESD